MEWLWNFFASEILSYILFAVWVIIMPIIITLLGRIKKSWSLPYTLMALVFTVACGLFIYNYIPMEWRISSGKIERTLHNWALKSGFSIKDASKEYARFQFIITDAKGKRVAVLNRKEDSIYRIFIKSKLMISKNDQKLLAEMNQEEKRQFISYIRIELLKYGISFRGIKYPLQDIGVSDEFVYDESLTMTAYLKNIMFVRRAKYLLNEIISQKIKDIQLAQHAVSS